MHDIRETSIVRIDTELIDLDKIGKMLARRTPIELSEQAIYQIDHCRKYLDKKLLPGCEPIYGINTGFGSLCNHHISYEDIEQLQVNLVRSHACGVGEEVPLQVVKIMLLLKIQSLSYGNSGVCVETVQRLVDFYNHDILPVIYQSGSLGASGDLAPLAHLSLPMIGEGEVHYQGKRYSGREINEMMGWQPLNFKAKEGLALLNGTQFMSAYGIACLLASQKLIVWSNIIAAIAIDAFDGRIEPFDPLIHRIRRQGGQAKTAEIISNLLEESEIIRQPKKHVQDPYSFRCIPQVHGATRDALDYVESVFLNEINSVTDNPNVFPDEDKILSGGNFHGQPLALALDFMCMAMAELGSISERRTYQLISGSRGLPPFLVAKPGLNSGLMIPQYTAASIVSLNKQLCSPASVDSIPSSNGQEDHVSMGANAATKALRVVENVKRILAIELLTATQALNFRRPLKTSPNLEQVINDYREKVSFIYEDRILSDDIHQTIRFIEDYIN